MKKEDKSQIIAQIKSTIEAYNCFYVTDIADLNSEKTSNLRKLCFNQNIKLLVVKNTLFKKALEDMGGDFSPLFGTLKGSTSIMFTNNSNSPAKLIKEFKKDKKNNGKPVLKAAYVQECFYVGEDQLESLITLKSKEQLLGEIVGLLQSPAKNVISALKSGGNTLHGVLETLSNK